ncbi:MAG: cupin domain-containing protein [Firmicutes bacterium]|nr:cupin domain-containing protein [Bacillota bacterium]
MFFKHKEIELTELVKGKNYRRVLAHSDSVMIVEVIFEKNAVGEPHTHEHEQISYVQSGEFEYTVGDVTKTITIGDSVYIPSNIIHGCKLLSDHGVLIDVFTPERKDFL